MVSRGGVHIKKGFSGNRNRRASEKGSPVPPSEGEGVNGRALPYFTIAV